MEFSDVKWAETSLVAKPSEMASVVSVAQSAFTWVRPGNQITASTSRVLEGCTVT